MSPNRRFGIGEWYGHSYLNLPQKQRQQFARGDSNHLCPFRIAGGPCIKRGGVCSFRLYEDIDGEINQIQAPKTV